MLSAGLERLLVKPAATASVVAATTIALHCEPDVLTVDIPQLAQALAERREQTRHPAVQNADERHLVRRLRSHRPWRREENDGERDDSHSAHGHHAAAGSCSLSMPAIFRQPSTLHTLIECRGAQGTRIRNT
jgi:hypothetical protein